MAPQYANDQPAGFTNRIEKVAIIGASGTMGKPFTEALLKTGKHTVTALTRVDSKSVMPKGVQVAHIDYEKPETIVEALRGQDFLIITLSVQAPRDIISNKLFQAAKDAGLRYVMPNCYGPNPFNGTASKDMGYENVQQEVETMKSLGLEPVIISCGFWYQFSLAGGLSCFGIDLAQHKAVLFDDGNVKTHTSTWPQCGRAVAALLSLPVLPKSASDSQVTPSKYAGGDKSTTAYISSFEISQNDMLESAMRVTNTTKADWTITHEPAKERFENARKLIGVGGLGLDGVTKLNFFEVFRMAMYTRVFFPGGDGLTEADMANKVLNLPQEDLDTCTADALNIVKEGLLNRYGRE